MIDIKGKPQPIAEKIMITVHFISGDMLVQPIPVDQADYVQEFMDWYRNPGKTKVWAWHCFNDRSIHMFCHAQIAAVDIEGYIEPEGRASRWYERLIDRFRTWRYG